MSRSLGVADTQRSVAFYRDVLGFEIAQRPDGVEATNGPALLHFDSQGSGSAVLFFQTDDVAAMHAAIRARGGQTSEIEKVNSANFIPVGYNQSRSLYFSPVRCRKRGSSASNSRPLNCNFPSLPSTVTSPCHTSFPGLVIMATSWHTRSTVSST